MKSFGKLLCIWMAVMFSGITYADSIYAKKNEDTIQMTYESLQSQQTVLGTVWMQTSAEYRAAVYQVFNFAKNRFTEEKSKNYDKKLAVIVDIDETVLDNIYTQAEYIKEGKKHLTISIGCSGGKHRSVTFVNKLAEDLEKVNYLNVYVSHREKEIGHW